MHASTLEEAMVAEPLAHDAALEAPLGRLQLRLLLLRGRAAGGHDGPAGGVVCIFGGGMSVTYTYGYRQSGNSRRHDE